MQALSAALRRLGVDIQVGKSGRIVDLPVYVDRMDFDDPDRPWWVRRTFDVWAVSYGRRFWPVPFKPSKRQYR